MRKLLNAASTHDRGNAHHISLKNTKATWLQPAPPPKKYKLEKINFFAKNNLQPIFRNLLYINYEFCSLITEV